MAEIGEPFESTFIILYALSYVFLVLALLSGYSLAAPSLQAYATVYLSMLTLSAFFIRGIKPPTKLAQGLLFGLPTLFLISATSQYLRQTLGLTVTYTPIPNLPASVLLTIMMTIPGATSEEGFFRIGLTNMLEPVMGTTWATITQAALFGIYHYYAYRADILAMLTAATAGLALGIIYAKTKSETAIAISHICFNAIAILGGSS